MWAARPTPAVNRGYRDGRAAAGRIARGRSRRPGTPTVYRGDRLPADVRGNVFVTEPAGNLVRRYVVKEGADGRITATQRASARRVPHLDRRALPSGQPAVGGRRHALHRRHVPRRDPARAVPVGVPEEPDPRPRAWSSRPGWAASIASCTRRRGAATRPALSAKTPADLVPVLEHPNGWWRDTAQRLLVERGDIVGGAGAGRAGRRRPRSADAAARALRRSTGSARSTPPTVQRALARRGAGGACRRGPRRRAVAGQGRRSGAGGRVAAGRRSRAAGPLAARASRSRRSPRPSRVEHAAQLLAQPRARSVRRRRRRQQPGRPRAPGAGAAAGAPRRVPRMRSARSPAPSRAAATPAAVADLWTRIADARRPGGGAAGAGARRRARARHRELRRAHRAPADARRARRSRCSAARTSAARSTRSSRASSTAWTGRASRGRPRRSRR